MTCKECEATIKTNPLAVSRAVRASVHKHVCECDSCWNNMTKWENEARAAGAYAGLTSKGNEASVDEDLTDPEFRAVAFDCLPRTTPILDPNENQ